MVVYALSVNVQVVAVFLGGVLLSDHLDAHYSVGYSWKNICIPAALLVGGFWYYSLFHYLLKAQRERGDKK